MEKVRNAITGLMLLLMLSMTFVPAVSASEAIPDSSSGTADSCECTDESIAQDSCGSCCGCTSDSCAPSDVTVTELEGEEKNKAIAMALANEDVKKLRQELLDQGYTPKVNDAEAAIVKAVLNDSVVELVGVRMPFESKEINKTQEIIFAYNPDTGESSAIIAESPWDCVTCAAAILGCAVCIASCAIIDSWCIACLLLSCAWVAPACCACVGCISPCPPEPC